MKGLVIFSYSKKFLLYDFIIKVFIHAIQELQINVFSQYWRFNLFIAGKQFRMRPLIEHENITVVNW